MVALDGLRGVAAVVVFVHHVFLTQPALAEPYRETAAGGLESFGWWATYTPLHLIWAGTEAVFVFFVLSGLVLALPVVERGWPLLAAYYPRRLLRLYLPVWAAVALALGWAAAFPRRWAPEDSWWVARYTPDPSATGVLDDVVLLFSPGSTNHVLWSLQWEVVYCLALPLVLLLGRALPRLWHVKALLVLVVLVVGAGTGSAALWFLPVFALGSLMALEHRRLARWAECLGGRAHPGGWWSVTLLASLGLLISYWMVPGASPSVSALTRGLQAVGACGVVFVVWHWSSARRVMGRPVAQWLGTRSFSLYLVHLPVVASVPLAVGGQPSLAVVALAAAVVTFPLAEVFHRLVERPSHRIAQRVGRRIAAARTTGSDPAVDRSGPAVFIPSPRAPIHDTPG